MTRNVTMAIDEDLLKKSRKIAIDKNTTVTGLIRNYLNHLVEQEEKSKNEIIYELAELLDRSQAVIGEKTWVREDLYER
ncbi:MAG: hypothetical protein KAW56_00320 [Candidatus Marinimicrobia bacterium]|nr:hypothetical protein [Candidatus Neomarinimicrobiota bacterium]